MAELKTIKTGWKPIPLSLKILFVVLILWMIGSVLNAPNSYEGVPLLGIFVSGIPALLVVLLLDIFGPVAFLFGLWTRKSWAPIVAYAYMIAFLINGIIALFAFSEQLGLVQILIPNIAELIFLIVVFSKRKYFG